MTKTEGSHDDLEQYTRKFNLVIHRIPERQEEDNVENVISLGNILKVNLTRGDIDIVHRLNTKSKPKHDRLSSVLVITMQKANFIKPE